MLETHAVEFCKQGFLAIYVSFLIEIRVRIESDSDRDRCISGLFIIAVNLSSCLSSFCWRLFFRSGSELTRIDAYAFHSCLSSQSILIPQSITELGRYWAVASPLRLEIFESPSSLRRMIDAGRVDLSLDFEILFVECHWLLNFPGYYVEIESLRFTRRVVRLLESPAVI
jgi:hypothetical protein